MNFANDASGPEDTYPAFAFMPVSRDKGRFAFNVSGNWRITFGWNAGDAIEVDLEAAPPRRNIAAGNIAAPAWLTLHADEGADHGQRQH